MPLLPGSPPTGVPNDLLPLINGGAAPPTTDARHAALLQKKAPKGRDMSHPSPKKITATSAQPKGLVQPGNIDLNNRPVVVNKDGTYSTVRSITIQQDNHYILIPTVVNGHVVSNRDAVNNYVQTGQHLGIFDTEKHADTYAKQLHEQQANEYQPVPTTGPPIPALQRYGVNMDIGQVNDNVNQLVSAFLKTHGYTPTPQHVFDVLKAQGITGPIDYNQLYDAPGSSKKDALVQQIARSGSGDTIATLPILEPKIGDLLKSLTDAIQADRHGTNYLTAGNTPNYDAWLNQNQTFLADAYRDPKKRDVLVQGMMRINVPRAAQFLSGGVTFNPSPKGIIGDVKKIVAPVVRPFNQIVLATADMPFGFYVTLRGLGLDAWDIAFQSVPVKGLQPTLSHLGITLPQPTGHPTRTVHLMEQMGHQMVQDVMNPITRSGYLALDIWAAASLGAGVGARLSAAGRAEGVAATARALAFKLEPKSYEMGFASYREHLPSSDTALLRVLQEKVPWIGRDARAERLIADQTDGFVDTTTQVQKFVTSLFGSTESTMRRARESRLQIELAAVLTPVAEMDRLARWDAAAKDVMREVIQTKSVKGWKQTTAKYQVGVQKALQLIMTDDPNPLAAWRNFHETQIKALMGGKEDLIQSTLENLQEENPKATLADALNLRATKSTVKSFDYSLRAHQAQLEAIDLAKEIVLNPPKRFKPLLDKVFEVVDAQEKTKQIALGLDDAIASQHVAEVGARVRFEKVINLDEHMKGVSDVDTSTLENSVARQEKTLEESKKRYTTAAATSRLHPGREDFKAELERAQANLDRHTTKLNNLKKSLQLAKDAARPLTKAVAPGGGTTPAFLRGHFEALVEKINKSRTEGKITTDAEEITNRKDNKITTHTLMPSGKVLGKSLRVAPIHTSEDYIAAMHELGHDAWQSEGDGAVSKAWMANDERLQKRIAENPGLAKIEIKIEREAASWDWAIRNSVDALRGQTLEDALNFFSSYFPKMITDSAHQFNGAINIGPMTSKLLGLKASGETQIADAIAELRLGTPGSAYYKLEPQKYRTFGFRDKRFTPSSKYGLRKPESPFKAWSGESIRIGDFRWDITNLTAESFKGAYRAAQARVQWQDLWDAGVKNKLSEHHMPIRDIKAVPDDLREVVQSLERSKMDKNFTKTVSDEKLQALQRWLYPSAEDLKAGENWKYVDERLIMNKAGRVDTSFWPTVDQLMGKGMTPFNEPMRLLLIFATPAYALNALGSAAMLLIQDGFLAPRELGRAMAASHFYGPEVTRLLDRMGGQTYTSALVSERNPFSRGSSLLMEMWQRVTDTHFRRAAVIHELRRNGLLRDKLSQEDLLKVLTADENSVKISQAAQTARKAMLDFNSMSWPERATLRHIFFVYSFVRSSGIWSLRFLRDHGFMADFLAQAGEGRAQQIEDMVGHMPDWFMRAGYFAVHPDVIYNPVQWSMPGMLEQIEAPLSALFGHTPYQSPSSLLGPAAQFGISALTGKDLQGNDLPGSGGTLERSFLSLWQETPLGQIGTKQKKAAKQALNPLAPEPVRSGVLDPIGAALSRERSGLNQTVFQNDGWWNTWGLALFRSAYPRPVNAVAGEARYWRDLKATDPKAFHQHEIDSVLQMVKRQQAVVGEAAPGDVLRAVDTIAHVSQAIDDYKAKHRGEPTPNQRTINQITLDALVTEGHIKDKATWTKRIMNDPDEAAMKTTQLQMLWKAGGEAWAVWVGKVNAIDNYATPKYNGVIQSMQQAGLGSYTSSENASREVKWGYGRRAETILTESKKLSDQVGATSGYQSDQARQDWIQYVNENDKPIMVKGVTFPSPFAYQFSSKTQEEQQKALAVYAKRKPSELTAIQNQLLTGVRPSPDVVRAWKTIYDYLKAAKEKLPFGKTLPSGYAINIQDQVAAQVPAYNKELQFERLPLAKRMTTYGVIQNSPNAAAWDWLLRQASAAYDVGAKAYKTDTGHIRQNLVSELWARYVPEVIQRLKADYGQGFTSELRLYTGATTPETEDAYLTKFVTKLVSP